MGLALAKSLVERGWNVGVLDKDRAAGVQAVKDLGVQAMFFEVDVTKYEDQASAFSKTWARWNRLDLGMQGIFSLLEIC